MTSGSFAGVAQMVTLVVVDIDSYATRPDPVRMVLRQTLFEVVHAAMAEVRLDPSSVGLEDSGDGVLLAIRPERAADTVVGELVRALRFELAERARSTGLESRLRVRVGVDQGWAAPTEHGWSGPAVVTVARLVDAPELRDALAAAPAADLGLIVSDFAYPAVVRQGTAFLDRAAFRRIELGGKGVPWLRAWINILGHPDAALGNADPGVEAGPRSSGSGQVGGPGYGGIVGQSGTVSGGTIGGGDRYAGPPPGPDFPTDR